MVAGTSSVLLLVLLRWLVAAADCLACFSTKFACACCPGVAACCCSFSHVLGLDGDPMHVVAAKEMKERGQVGSVGSGAYRFSRCAHRCELQAACSAS
jgi:hypothetical protein